MAEVTQHAAAVIAVRRIDLSVIAARPPIWQKLTNNDFRRVDGPASQAFAHCGNKVVKTQIVTDKDVLAWCEAHGVASREKRLFYQDRTFMFGCQQGI